MVNNDCENYKQLAWDQEELLVLRLGMNKDLIYKVRQLESEVREM